MKALRRQDGFTLVDILIAVALVGIVTAMAIPMADSAARGYRMKGDAQGLANVVSLAKMRAASRFSRARVRADLAANSYRLEVWDKAASTWVLDDGVVPLSPGVTFGFGALATPPPNTQDAIGQSPLCSGATSLTANPIANSACIVFNSRGVPSRWRRRAARRQRALHHGRHGRTRHDRYSDPPRQTVVVERGRIRMGKAMRQRMVCSASENRSCRSAAGFSLLETVFALGILLVVAVGVLPLGVIAVSTTENQGHLMARSTEYAQDKMEQLLALAYGDSTSDTRVFPATFARREWSCDWRQRGPRRTRRTVRRLPRHQRQRIAVQRRRTGQLVLPACVAGRESKRQPEAGDGHRDRPCIGGGRGRLDSALHRHLTEDVSLLGEAGVIRIIGTDPRDARGFSIVEAMIATTVLMVVCATVMRGVLGLTDVSRLVSNRTDMHNGVRNATELLTQEVGQAGRISLPGPVSLAAAGVEGDGTITVTSTAGMFVGEKLQIGSDNEQETIVVGAINGAVITLAAAVPPGLRYPHVAATPVMAPGGFAAGVVPSNTANGSTPNRLKIFGDIHDDGNMVYVEYWCDIANGRLYRNSMTINPAPANKPVPTVEQILIDNIEQNPDGTPCFTYQTKVVTGTTFVVDVAITLTVRTQQRDKNTNDFQRETKALLNVSPRNVFNTWQMASLDIDNRVQPTPATVTGLLADPVEAVVVVDP